MTIKVGVVGCGTIGKRVADAILLQDDMELVGIVANSWNYKVQAAQDKGIAIYASMHLMSKADPTEQERVLPPFHHMLREVDIVVDCTPKGIPEQNRSWYEQYNVKAIFQGGEKANIGQSFVAQVNWEAAVDADFVRVVSCNTTGLCRTLSAIHKKYGIEGVHATMIRRAADPWDIYHGPVNAIVPHLVVPSHHGPDVRTIMPDVDIFTTSLSVPTTLMHVHSVSVDLIDKSATVEDVIELFRNTTRVRVVSNADGIRSTAEIMEFAKDLGRERGDMPEVCVWTDTIGGWHNKIMYIQAVHQESDVVPENIDAIRAMTMPHMGQMESIAKTNKSLGII